MSNVKSILTSHNTRVIWKNQPQDQYRRCNSRNPTLVLHANVDVMNLLTDVEGIKLEQVINARTIINNSSGINKLEKFLINFQDRNEEIQWQINCFYEKVNDPLHEPNYAKQCMYLNMQISKKVYTSVVVKSTIYEYKSKCKSPAFKSESESKSLCKISSAAFPGPSLKYFESKSESKSEIK